MVRNQNQAEPIVHTLDVFATPQAVYRAITSQTELRRWWAPRVILSRNLVSQQDGREMEMRPLTQEKDRLIRYLWQPVEREDEALNTVITFEIEDLGVSRDTTGEGIRLHIIHDGWTNREERDQQAKVWKSAVVCLEALLKGEKLEPWWEGSEANDGFRQVNLTAIRKFLQKMEEDAKGKLEKRQSVQNLEQICEELDGVGQWYIKENGNEIELRFKDSRLFNALKNGTFVILWRELENLVGDRLQDFASRLSIEQDLEIHPGKVHDRIPASMIQPSLWNAWCRDLINESNS